MCSDSLARLCEELRSDCIIALVDEAIATPHKEALACLDELSPTPHRLLLVGDEKVKELAMLEKVVLALNELGATRRSLLVAVGGGALLDFAGFLAAVYKRGIAVAYIPTTLLAMVDAAFGGKTALNLGEIKNLIGVIRQPSAVFLDLKFLETLPKQAIISGYGELLKYGVLVGDPLWSELLATNPLEESEALTELVSKAAQIKQSYIASDLYDNGIRRHLNLGHTVGHAFEAHSLSKAYGGSALQHGEAILWGMVCELFIAHVRCLFPSKELHKLEAFSQRYATPFPISCQDYDALLVRARQDKKNGSDGIRIIAPRELGKVTEITVTEEELKTAFDYYRDRFGY